MPFLVLHLLECTRAAFPAIVWVGSKNRKDGGKHAETELSKQTEYPPTNLLLLFLL